VLISFSKNYESKAAGSALWWPSGRQMAWTSASPWNCNGYLLSIWLAVVVMCLGAIAADLPSNDPLPQAFDSSIGTNFTSPNCPRFFKTFLSDKAFTECYPFSLLLQTSAAFFANEQSFHKLNRSMEATCKVNLSKCSNIMSSYSNKIRQQENCGADYNAQNPFVLQAVIGLSSYRAMYHAGCQQMPSGTYCFADAVTNTSSQHDSYPYFLPLGISLPADAHPSCSQCVKNVMETFASAASDRGQVISNTYTSAARQLDKVCGPGWIPTQVSGGTRRAPASLRAVVIAGLAVIACFHLG
jgi:hypothetical protein